MIGSPPMPTLVRYADAQRHQLRGGLVAQRSAARDDAHVALQVDVRRHDAEHGAARADDARAIRPDQQGAALFRKAAQISFHPHHVLRGHAVGNGADQAQAGRGRLHDRIGAERGCDEGDGSVGAGGGDRVAHGVENRQPKMVAAAPCRG